MLTNLQVNKLTTLIRVNGEVHQRLKVLAAVKGMSVGKLIEQLLNEAEGSYDEGTTES